MVRLLAVLMVCMSVFTAGNVAAELKIAIINTQQAILQTDEAQAKAKVIESDLKADEESVLALRSEIQAAQEQLIKSAEIMSDVAKEKARKKIEDQQIEYQFQVKKLQKALNERQQELFNEMAPKLDAALKDMIELEGYDVLMERQSLLYVNSKHDITRKVTEKLNDKK
ncbi:MAG: OmpH family outer membrane protein [Pseudomonadales bacterium]|nr:OmpH family outer membrane protein [Pseudomonadales bacterium]